MLHDVHVPEKAFVDGWRRCSDSLMTTVGVADVSADRALSASAKRKCQQPIPSPTLR